LDRSCACLAFADPFDARTDTSNSNTCPSNADAITISNGRAIATANPNADDGAHSNPDNSTYPNADDGSHSNTNDGTHSDADNGSHPNADAIAIPYTVSHSVALPDGNTDTFNIVADAGNGAIDIPYTIAVLDSGASLFQCARNGAADQTSFSYNCEVHLINTTLLTEKEDSIALQW